MEATYQIVGGDGLTYGPVSLEQLRAWISEGRINADSRVLRAGQSEWSTAAALPETGLAPTPTETPVAKRTPVITGVLVTLDKRVRSGASWFFWIAGLSLINSIVLLSGSDWGFILGLGVTQIIDVIAREFGTAGKVVGLALDLGAAATLIFLGYMACRRHNWAFITGMVLYLLDGLLFLLVFDLLALGFHVFALLCIFQGFRASRELRAELRESHAT